MDAEAEQQLLDRVKALEEQMVRLLGPESKPETPEVTAGRMLDCVFRLPGASFERVLRELPKDRWASAFYRLPRKAIEKLKASVSKNAWKELTEEWTQNVWGFSAQWDQREFLKATARLEEMGQVVLLDQDGKFPHYAEEEFQEPGPSFDFEAQWEKQKKTVMAETRKWVVEELVGLI